MRDLRAQLAAPNLPIVIGELGMHGNLTDQTAHWKPRVEALRQAQLDATELTFGTTVAETARYVTWVGGECTTPVPTGETACACQGYHYYNNAFSYYYAGLSMGNALLSLWE